MLYTIWHPVATDGLAMMGLTLPAWPDAYRPVGTVEAEGREAAFAATNDNPRWPARSTSVGDVLMDDRAGRAWRCAPSGWARVQ